ncbi:hypothetical protein TSPI_04437 [Trichinella spiralis]|uniref:Uncharacterized protein n=1 Tax=Trichinella spiralis TaxID=6334 RepID=A0ABR3L2Q2_TRISP
MSQVRLSCKLSGLSLITMEDVAHGFKWRGETLSVVIQGFGGGCHEAHNSPFVKLCVRTRVWSGQQVVWAVISILAWPHLRSLELWGEEREVILPVHIVLGVHYVFRMLGQRCKRT